MTSRPTYQFRPASLPMVEQTDMMKSTSLAQSRIESIDLLRGIVMIIMALDHVRLYFHFDSIIFSPTDLERTTPALFATRLITHLCAPTFIFLAGTSAYFISQRKTIRETSIFLVTRGLWLILLQFTIIRFGWNFDPSFHFNSSNILSTIGFAMLTLAFLIHFRLKTILITGLILVIGHNTLDKVSFESGSVGDVIWSFLHVRKLYVMNNDYSFQFLYPVIPWIGVMALGYCLGRFYDQDYSIEKRKKAILQLGISSLLVFIILRWTNIYGDPMPWVTQHNIIVTIMSFLNVEKYPPSLLYLCLTLGVSLVVLGMLEGQNLRRWRPIKVFGKVALFYYTAHIYVIHGLALLVVAWMGFPWQAMIFKGLVRPTSPLLMGKYGFTLGETYLIWVAIILLLNPLCLYWNSFKIRNKSKWWISYV